MSEALIFASTNPQYDDRFFIELQVQYMKIPSSNLGRTCCVQKLFLTFRTIFVHNMFSPSSAKRKASDKDLPVNNDNMFDNYLLAFIFVTLTTSPPHFVQVGSLGPSIGQMWLPPEKGDTLKLVIKIL